LNASGTAGREVSFWDCPRNSGMVGKYDQTLGKIRKWVWEIGWDGSVLCAQNVGVLPIDS